MNTDDHYEEAMILMLTLDGSEFSFKTTNQNTEIIVLNEDQLTYAPPAMVEVINDLALWLNFKKEAYLH